MTIITVPDVSCANCGGTCELYLIPDVCFYKLIDPLFGRKAWICLGCLAAQVGIKEGTFTLLRLEQQMRGLFHFDFQLTKPLTYIGGPWPPDPYVIHLLLAVPASPASDRYSGQTMTLEQQQQTKTGKEKGLYIVTPEMIESETLQRTRGLSKTGRNDPCPCGSGKKYKKCHGAAAA